MHFAEQVSTDDSKDVNADEVWLSWTSNAQMVCDDVLVEYDKLVWRSVMGMLVGERAVTWKAISAPDSLSSLQPIAELREMPSLICHPDEPKHHWAARAGA